MQRLQVTQVNSVSRWREQKLRCSFTATSGIKTLQSLLLNYYSCGPSFTLNARTAVSISKWSLKAGYRGTGVQKMSLQLCLGEIQKSIPFSPTWFPSALHFICQWSHTFHDRGKKQTCSLFYSYPSSFKLSGFVVLFWTLFGFWKAQSATSTCKQLSCCRSFSKQMLIRRDCDQSYCNGLPLEQALAFRLHKKKRRQTHITQSRRQNSEWFTLV